MGSRVLEWTIGAHQGDEHPTVTVLGALVLGRARRFWGRASTEAARGGVGVNGRREERVLGVPEPS